MGFNTFSFVGFCFALPNLHLLDSRDKRRYSDLARVKVLEIIDLEFDWRLFKK